MIEQPFDVSRETQERLHALNDLVYKWTQRINLVSKSDQEHIWDRHILDSIQLARYGYACDHWVDIGSGGGFPGLVVAVYAKETWPDTQFTFIESDHRKCAFLRTAIRELGLKATVISKRIEECSAQSADILSARALADLSALLKHADRHLAEDGYALFQKGANWRKEVEDARKAWRFECEAFTSQTQDAAVILKIKGVSRD